MGDGGRVYGGRRSLLSSFDNSGFGGKRGGGDLRQRGILVMTGDESRCAGPGVAKGLNPRVRGCRGPDEGREVSDDIPRRVSATGEYDGDVFSRDAGIGCRGDRRSGDDLNLGVEALRLRVKSNVL